MKNFVVLMLVLGVASLASATLQISVGGVQEPIDSEITILPSDHLVLDIWTDAAIPADWGGTTVVMLVDPAAGSLTVTGTSYENVSGDAGMGPLNPGASMWGINPPEDGIWAGMSVTGLGFAAGTTLYDFIDFHCEAPGETVISLYEYDYVTAVLVDQVTIHQAPEPMTMALLGLGGLFLRRRK